VHAPAVLVYPVPRQRVGEDRHHGPHVRRTGPQTVVHRHVRCVELLGAGCPEPLSWIVRVPDIEVAFTGEGFMLVV
jgi:hypothetical protein